MFQLERHRLLQIDLALLDDDFVTHQPQVDLFEADLPTPLEFLHPFPISRHVRHVNGELDQTIAVRYAAMSPMTFDTLSLVAGRTEMIRDFQDGFSPPIGRDI